MQYYSFYACYRRSYLMLHCGVLYLFRLCFLCKKNIFLVIVFVWNFLFCNFPVFTYSSKTIYVIFQGFLSLRKTKYFKVNPLEIVMTLGKKIYHSQMM